MTDASRGGGNSKVNGSGSKAWGDQGHVPPPPGLPERSRALIRSVFLFWKDQSARTNCNLVVPCKAEDRDGFTGWVADYWTPFREAYAKHRRGEDGNSRASTGGPAEVSIAFAFYHIRAYMSQPLMPSRTPLRHTRRRTCSDSPRRWPLS